MDALDCSYFEEDVILANSPLGHYFKELDSSENSTFYEEFTLKENNFECTKTSLNETANNKSRSFKSFFLEKYEKTVKYVSSLFLQNSHLKDGDTFLRDYLSRIMENKLLIQEDRAFISSLSCDESDTIHDSPTTLGAHWIFLSISAIFMSSLYANSLINHYYLYVLHSILSIIISIYIFSFFRFNTLRTRYTRACQLLSLSTVSTEQLKKVLKKCIRLIQESELIARGFTTVSVLGIAEHLELSQTLPMHSPNRQFTELRKCIFTWMRDVFMDFRKETLKLIEKLPVDPVYSFPHTLASIELSEFGVFVNGDVKSPEASQLTDNFSISSLKTMYHLMEMQVSEFLKHVILRLSFSKNDDQNCLINKFNDVFCLELIVTPIDRRMSKMCDDAFKTYKFYQSIEASYVSDNSNEILSSNKPNDKVSDLKVLVHNMSLHLKAALLRSIEMEASLDSNISRDLDEEYLQKMSHLLNVVNSEVSALKDCYTLCNSILDRFLNPNETVSSEFPLSPKVQLREDLSAAKIKRCDMELEIQDEVFEAFLTKVPEIISNHDSISQTEESHKNVELTSFLMKELKNVLVVKADEHRAREEVALAKKTGHAESNCFMCVEDTKAKYVDCENSKIKNDLVLEESDLNNKFKQDIKENTEHNTIENREVEKSEKDELMETRHSKIEEDNEKSFAFQDESIYPGSHQRTSFSASIALLAAQRQKSLGLATEEFIDGSGESDLESS